MVVFGDEWGLHPTSAQHIIRRLAQQYRMLYVNASGLRRPTLTWYDVRRVASRLRALVQPRAAQGNVSFQSPFVVPFNDVGAVRRWNRKHLVRTMRRELEARHLDSPVLFAVTPVGAEVVGSLDESLIVYYITDEYAELPNVCRSYVRDLEAVLLDQADVIFVTSRTLQLAKQGRKTQPILLPHGVDFEHFSAAVGPATPIPAELAGLPRPILGFYGLLAPWIDRSILEQLASGFSHGSVVLIGPAWAGCPLPRAANIHWLGPRSYGELPSYAAHFDVALIPFVNNSLVASVNPLKFLEYLALGLPVVSTPLPDLERFDGLFYRAENAEEFIQQARLALQQDCEQRRQERRMAASRESWQSRVDTVVQAMQRPVQVGCAI
jgi:glycosyltransferase involved in cell wall biosynthesis